MDPHWRSTLAHCMLPLLMAELSVARSPASTQADLSGQTYSQVDSLGLPTTLASQLKQDLRAHNYVAAEKSLLTEISRDPHSPEAGRLLQFVGGVYFLDQDAWGAAVAWNKAKAISPLPPALDFSLAMAYIRIGHPDWARKDLKALATQEASNALYPYWLGRLDYDADQYEPAILQFQRAIQLAPEMAQAYNNLGLCYSRLDQTSLAVVSYEKAIDLNLKSGHTDAWPYLNLAIAERASSQPSRAEADLRTAVRLNPGLAPAHFQLGNVLEDRGQMKDAIAQFQEAARLDPNYAEPHYALARDYRKLGNRTDAKRELDTYLLIHSHPKAPAFPVDPTHP